jgi:hypothetical protein
MISHKIEKQKLLSEPYSQDALKLARGLYYTFLEEEEPLEMVVKLSTIFKLLHLENNETSLIYINSLLHELNEPLAVKNFMYMGKSYDMRFVIFSKYTIKDSELIISLSEEFLHAQKEYMLDSFLIP